MVQKDEWLPHVFAKPILNIPVWPLNLTIALWVVWCSGGMLDSKLLKHFCIQLKLDVQNTNVLYGFV